MPQVGVRHFQDQPTKYLQLARKGQRVVVTEHGKPVAVLTGVEEKKDLSSEIDRLYERLSDLVARQADDPSLGDDVARLKARLQQLQARETEAMRASFLENRILDPSRVWKALEEADRVLASEDPAA